MRTFLGRLAFSLAFYLMLLPHQGKVYGQSITMVALESISSTQVSPSNFPFSYEVTLGVRVPANGIPINIGNMKFVMSVNANNFAAAELDASSFTTFSNANTFGGYNDPVLTTTVSPTSTITQFEVNVTYNPGVGGTIQGFPGGPLLQVCKVRLGLATGRCGERSLLNFIGGGSVGSTVRDAGGSLVNQLDFSLNNPSNFVLRPTPPNSPELTLTPSKSVYCSSEAAIFQVNPNGTSGPYSLAKKTPGGSRGTVLNPVQQISTSGTNLFLSSLITNSTLSNSDSLLVLYTNNLLGGSCLFESNKVELLYDDPIITQDPPTVVGGLNSDDGIKICGPGQSPQGYTYTTIPALPQGSTPIYQWRVDPPGALGTLVAVTPDSLTVNITYNPAFTGFATLFVSVKNACQGNSEGRLNLSISPNIPGPTGLPTFRTGLPIVDSVCISDTGLQNLKVPANPTADYAHTYQWRVFPDSAWSAPAAVNTEDSTQVLLNWNRRYPLDWAYVKVRAVNGCGFGPWDSVRVKLRPLPPKQGRAFNVANPLIDTVCQSRIPDSTQFSFEVKRPDLITPGKKKYYWWVLRAPEKNGQIYQPAGNPNPTRWVQGVDSSDTDTNYIPWNPRFYGWVKIVVAARSRYCNFGNTAYTLPLMPRDTSGLGDTITKYFFVRPLPLLPSPPVGERAISVKDTGDTIRLWTRLGARFATSYGWFVTDTGKIRDSVNLGRFLHIGNNPRASDSLFTYLKLADTLRPGEYYVRTYGINQCGLGDTSRVLIIRVSSDAPQVRADTLSSFTVLGCNTPYYRVNSSDSIARWSLCQNPPNIVYKTSHPDAAYFKWKLTPDTAGALFVGPNPLGIPRGIRIPSPPCPGSPAPELGLDSNTVVVDFNDNFVGTCTLTVYPVNGENNSDTALWELHKAERIIKIFEAPKAFAGISGNVITGGKYMLGGGDKIGTNIPRTAVGGTKPYKSFTWTPAELFPGVAAVDSNPVIRPLFNINPAEFDDKTFNVSLSITDSNQCTSAPSTAQIVVELGYAFNTKVFLEGPMDTVTGLMNSKIYDSTTNPYGEPGGYFARWIKRTTLDIGDTFMSAGYRTIPVGPNGEKPVDAVTFELRSDSTSNASSGQAPVVASGRAWLMQDGTIRDFETGTDPLVRLRTLNPPVSGLRPRNDGVFLVLNHRNHLQVMGSRFMLSTFKFNNPGTQPGDSGYVDLTDSTNLNFLKNYGAGVKKINTGAGSRWVAVAGDFFRESDPSAQVQKEINANDMTAFRVYHFNQTNLLNFPISNIYAVEDLNLDGRVDFEDYDLINKNSVYLFNSMVP